MQQNIPFAYRRTGTRLHRRPPLSGHSACVVSYSKFKIAISFILTTFSLSIQKNDSIFCELTSIRFLRRKFSDLISSHSMNKLCVCIERNGVGLVRAIVKSKHSIDCARRSMVAVAKVHSGIVFHRTD